MIRLALRTLRFRAGGFVASFVALFFGAVIVLACGGLLETGIRAAVPPQRLADAPIVVAGDQSYPGSKSGQPLPDRVLLDAGLVGVVGAVPGVAAAVPDVSVPLAGSAGHGWSASRLGPYTLVAGVPPTNGQVVLNATAHQRIGATVTFVVRGVAAQYRVSGLVSGPSGVFFTDADAQLLFGRAGRIDDIGVLATPGTDIDQLRQRIDAAIAGHRAVTLTGDDRGVAEFPDALRGGTDLIPLAAVFGGLATTVAIFVVGSTLALLVRQRQREMALLRAIGATPRQLRRMIVAEALAVSVLATALAVVPGQWFGRWLFGQLAGSGVVPAMMVFHEGWIPQVSAAGTALLTATCAAFLAARGAARARPTDALAEAALQQRWLSAVRLIAAVLCLAGATALAIVTATVMSGTVAASTAAPSAMLWAAGLALLAPGLTRVLTAILRWPLRAVSGVTGALAITNARARKIGLAGAITPVMLVTGLAVAMIYLQTSQDVVSQQVFTNGLRADAVITSTTGGLPPDLVAKVAALPDVSAASAYVNGTGYLGDANEMPLQGITSGAIVVPPTSGTYEDLRGNTVALPDNEPYPIGSTVHMRFGDGEPADLTVVATFPAPRGFESALVPANLLLAHTTTGLLPQILVRTKGSPAALNRALAGLRVPGLVVADRDAVLAAHAKQDQTSAWVSYLMVAMIIGYAVLALVNTLIAATTNRRREFALQRLIGATRSQILRMMGVEAALTAMAGVVLGTMVAVGTLAPFGYALNRSPYPHGPLWIYLAVVGGAVVLTFAATLAPASAVLRARPVEAAES
ncbi:MAG TPA: FtsX-like permease family protein [Pseudonocardiaceae bacterium]